MTAQKKSRFNDSGCEQLQTQPLSPPRILVVEDEKDLRRLTADGYPRLLGRNYFSTGHFFGTPFPIVFLRMKTSILIILGLALTTMGAQGQVVNNSNGGSQPDAAPAPTARRVVERGANHRVWQWETYERSPGGIITTSVHKYTELATGLNYTNSYGQLTESKEQITILPTGGAAATQGQHKVYFPADIYNGVLEVITPDGKHLRSRPVGISYDDGSNSVFIATLKDALGYLTSSNQVTYRDAFTNFRADLVCTYRRGGLVSEVVC